MNSNATSRSVLKLILQLFPVYSSGQLDYFVIGLTATSPAVQSPAWLSYTVCGQYPGLVAAGAAASLECKPNLLPYRYIIVQSPVSVGALAVCELQVFLKCKFIFTTPPEYVCLIYLELQFLIYQNRLRVKRI
jgi:hypothetical protein